MVDAIRVLHAVQEQLESYGLVLDYDDRTDSTAPVVWQGRLGRSDGRPVRVVLLSPMTVTSLGRIEVDPERPLSSDLPTLVVGRQIHERSASAFREMGLAYADTVGNAYIRDDGVLIDVRGRRPSITDDRDDWRSDQASTPVSSNLFSTGRAQVIAMLLTSPALASTPVRAIARIAGVSTGQAHGALSLLEEAGYLADHRLRPDRVDELLDLWTASYPRGLGPKLAIASYTSNTDVRVERDEVLNSPEPSADDLLLSGESAPGAGVSRPISLTVYTRDWTSRRAVAHRWRAAPSARSANIHVRRRFWSSTDTDDPIPDTNANVSADRNDDPHQDPHRNHVAPWPLVYADLITTGDARLVEVAREWRSRHRAT